MHLQCIRTDSGRPAPQRPRVERGDPVAEVRVMERSEPVPQHNPFEGPECYAGAPLGSAYLVG